MPAPLVPSDREGRDGDVDGVVEDPLTLVGVDQLEGEEHGGDGNGGGGGGGG